MVDIIIVIISFTIGWYLKGRSQRHYEKNISEIVATFGEEIEKRFQGELENAKRKESQRLSMRKKR